LDWQRVKPGTPIDPKRYKVIIVGDSDIEMIEAACALINLKHSEHRRSS